MVVHEAEAGDGGPQIQVYHMLPCHPPQVLGVAHPRQRIHYLIVPWQLVSVPTSAMHIDEYKKAARELNVLLPNSERAADDSMMGLLLLLCAVAASVLAT